MELSLFSMAIIPLFDRRHKLTSLLEDYDVANASVARQELARTTTAHATASCAKTRPRQIPRQSGVFDATAGGLGVGTSAQSAEGARSRIAARTYIGRDPI